MRTLASALATLLAVATPGVAAPGAVVDPAGQRTAVFLGYYRPT
jgi:hypothetical protein